MMLFCDLGHFDLGLFGPMEVEEKKSILPLL
jgi:hypothetical protein